jgi:hypothetical protein
MPNRDPQPHLAGSLDPIERGCQFIAARLEQRPHRRFIGQRSAELHGQDGGVLMDG